MSSLFSDLTDAQLREELMHHGLNIGPVTATTRSLYEKKLQKLQTEAASAEEILASREYTADAAEEHLNENHHDEEEAIEYTTAHFDDDKMTARKRRSAPKATVEHTDHGESSDESGRESSRLLSEQEMSYRINRRSQVTPTRNTNEESSTLRTIGSVFAVIIGVVFMYFFVSYFVKNYSVGNQEEI